MKKTLFLLVSTFFIYACGSFKKADTSTKAVKETSANIIEFASTITASELKEMLYTYASDEFEGRETAQPGQKKAVEYIKNHYVNLGISSPISKDNFFQKVPLQIVKTPKTSLIVNGTAFNYFDDYISQTVAPTGIINTNQIVYLGYGIDHKNYSDYKNIDVKGKIVVVKGGEPKNENGTFKISGTTKISKWSNGRQSLPTKRDAAKKHGAKALFFMDSTLFTRYSPFYKRASQKGGNKMLSLISQEKEIYFFLINKKLGKALINNIENNTTALQVDNTAIELQYENVLETTYSENVVAYIEGSEKPDEYIVISAHLDHIGIHDGIVNNGADDDGSGTVAVLEIAEAFKTAVNKGYKPKRSILFLHVTGEEKGLLGSRYYTDYNPIIPLKNTVANLNIDMIGRTDPKREGNRNYIYLIGSDKLSTELHTISEDINSKYTNIELDYTYNHENDPNRFYYRSDHYNFAKNNIPVIFYFNGTHADYHKPTDTPDKIEYDLLENRTRLVFYTAWQLANQEERIKLDLATN